MNQNIIDASTEGKLLKTQIFNTERGEYQLVYKRHKGRIYMFKMLDGKLVEAVDFNELKGV